MTLITFPKSFAAKGFRKKQGWKCKSCHRNCSFSLYFCGKICWNIHRSPCPPCFIYHGGHEENIRYSGSTISHKIFTPLVFATGVLCVPPLRSQQIIDILKEPKSAYLFTKETMTRFLGFALLLVIALPLFAQDELPTLGQALPHDPALLIRMKDKLSFELRETQRALGVINPSDVQLVETLKTRQADLARQMNDVTRQLQTSGTNRGNVPLIPEVRPGMLPPAVQSQDAELRQSESQPVYPIPPVMPDYPPMQPPNRSDLPGVLMPPYSYVPPYPPADMMPNNVPHWNDQDRAWEAMPWGPRLPKELTEMKQSIESLQKEVAELRTTIKALETQIQLLNRTILLSDRTLERRITEQVREE